jgi:hypothetical protein
MWNQRHFQRAAAVLVLVTLSGPALAQFAERTPGMLSVQFPGGTVGEYVESLRVAAKPEPANVAVSESAAAAMLPPIRLDQVTMATALAAIEYIAPTSPMENWVIASLDRSGGPSNAFAVTLVRNSGPGAGSSHHESVQGAGQDRLLKVFSVKELIDRPPPGGGGPETVMSAVELALRMDSAGSLLVPEVKFHPESGLLFLDASPQQIGAVSEVLGRMEGDTQRARDRADRLTRQRNEDEVAVRVAEAKLRQAQMRLEYVKDSVDRVRAMREKALASDQDVRVAEMELAEVISEVDLAQVERDAAVARASATAASMEGLPDGLGEARALRDQVVMLRQQVATLEAKIKELEGSKK